MYIVFCGAVPVTDKNGTYLFENEGDRNKVAIEHQQSTGMPVSSYLLLKCSEEHVLRLSFTGKPYVDARFPGVY